MFNKGTTKSTFSSSSKQYSFQSATATSSSTTSRVFTSGGTTSSSVNKTSTSSSTAQHQGAVRRSSATAISNSPTNAFVRTERQYSSVRGPLGESYSGSATGAVFGALGSFGGNRLERSISSINRPLALPCSSSVATGRTALSSVPQKTTWDAKPYPGSSYSSGNNGPSAPLPSSSYSGPLTPLRIARPLGSTSSTISSSVERYNLRDQKGYVLIFHHKHFKNAKAIRVGSEKDLQLLKHFFTRYRVKKPDLCENFTVLRIKDKMKKISEKDFSKYSCLLVIVMSHGETRDRIQAYDDLYNFEHEVVERVLMNATLKDKPKLFFIQACKGSATMQHDVISVATNKNDLLKCYSTYEGTVSLRNTVTGTYFIQTLFSLIEEQGDKDVADLMILTRKRFKDDRIPQAPTDTSTLTKKFYFQDLK